MSFTRWLSHRLGLSLRPTKARPARRTFRPRLEYLEDRCVPSTLHVARADDSLTEGGTLRWAVARAQSGDTIDFIGDAGRNGVTLTQGELILTQQNLTIEAATGQPPVTISGDNLSRIFEVAGGASVTLSDLAITGGNGVANPTDNPQYGAGGGVLVDGGASLNVTDCSFTGNTAPFGGAIDLFEGTLTVSNSTLSGNSAFDGGAIYNFYGNATLSDSTLSGNAAVDSGGFNADPAGFGGGLDNEGNVAVQISGTTFSGNSAFNDGGAIFNGGFGTNGLLGKVTLDNGTDLSDNSAFSGGGVANFGMTLTVNDSTVDHNSANTGGGLYNGGTLTVSASRLSSNSATQYGGGVFNSRILTISDSTLTDNTAGGPAGTFGGGGAVANFFGMLTVNGSTLSGNSAGFSGGGIFNFLGTAIVAATSLSDSTGYVGGGIMNYLGTLTVSDGCTLTGNAAFVGGGVYNYFGTTTISDSVLSHNSASSTTNAGGGLYNFGGTATVEDSSQIIDNSAPGGALGADVLNHGTLYQDLSSIIGILDGNPAVPI
ncbi:MAG TPA: hypothetical protein DDY78_17000 [Planctomycetales bacterium]|nr:hypothetical protein [Planctomycetales bacterium]